MTRSVHLLAIGPQNVFCGLPADGLRTPALPVHCEIGCWGHGLHADVLAACGAWQARQLRAVQHLPRIAPGWNASRLVLLTDCMSPVAGFEAQHTAFLDAMRAQGAQLATSSQISL